MFTKLFLIAAVGAGALGTGTTTGRVPTGIEFAAGPVRVEAGNGSLLSAHIAKHTSLRLTINLQGERRLQIKF